MLEELIKPLTTSRCYSTQADHNIRLTGELSTHQTMPGVCSSNKVDSKSKGSNTKIGSDHIFARPTTRVPSRSRSTSSSKETTLKKSLSYQNIKTANATESISSLQLNRRIESKRKHHLSTTNISTSTCSKQFDLASSEPQFQSRLGVFDPQKSQSNAHRIYVNSDLLSRVEKEKKQYEARISELTQITERRKMEIEKLSFEVRRAKEEASKALSTVDEAKVENNQLRSQLAALGSPWKKDVDHASSNVDSHQTKSSSTPLSKRYAHCTSSPPESLGTTTRLTPGGATTCVTGAVTASSRSSEWNDYTTGFDLPNTDDSITFEASICSDLENIGMDKITKHSILSVATLQGRLQQMEEANYTTNEELQATLQELWDLQRCVDEAQEETHSLAFERAILLEALSTQTSKLEHCRFQIEQLKHLLLTDRTAQSTGSRENHFCELYSSIEQEKQVLLGQNNDLAQSSDSLARECRVLTEKASALQDSYDSLEAEHETLKKAYQKLATESNLLKAKMSGDVAMGNCKPDGRSQACQTQLNVIAEGDQSNAKFQNKLNDMTKKYIKIKDQLEVVQSERERETTEWRLYERDLLKAVQVADAIKNEAEMEMRRLVNENSTMKDQMDKISRESSSLKSELVLIKDQMVGLMNANRADTSEVVKPPVDNNNTNYVASSRGSSLLHPYSAAAAAAVHRSSNFNHFNTASFGSPGAPGRSSGLTTGPTVRSLIQSIENQVKAVQYQKRGIASKQNPSPMHLFGSNKCTTSTGATNNNTSTTVKTVPTQYSSSNPSSAKKSTTDAKSLLNHSASSMNKANSPAGSQSPPLDLDLVQSSAPGGPTFNATTGGRTRFATAESPSKTPLKLVHNLKHINASAGSKDGLLRRNNSVCLSESNSLKLGLTNNSSSTNDGLNSDFDANTNTYPHTHRHYTATSNTSSTNSTKDSLAQPDLMLSNTPVRSDSSSRASRRLTTPTSVSESKNKMNQSMRLSSNGVSEAASNSSSSSPPPPPPPPPSCQTDNSDSAEVVDPSASFHSVHQLRQDPLQELARLTGAGSKRNALLKWCQSRVNNYPGVEVTNFSRSWNNGLALCALLHTYVPTKIPWNDLVTSTGTPTDKRRCFEVAFKVAENEGIPTILHLQDMLSLERPEWNTVMAYITSIYKHYEVEALNVSSAPGVP